MTISRLVSEGDGIVFVLGEAGEENIATYPLALPRSEYIQPEPRSVDRLWDWQASMIDLAIRSQRR